MATLQTAFDEQLKFYEEAASEYFQTLPLEHFMESQLQGTQRKITLESFGQIHELRPDIWCFNEMLIQFREPSGEDGSGKPQKANLIRVVPDNLILLQHTPMRGKGAFSIPVENTIPFMVMEYVSRSNREKDYELNPVKYAEGGVPYYLTMDWEEEGNEIRLRHLDSSGHYAPLFSNAAGRFEIPELELELGLHEDWLRYWFRGELLPMSEEWRHSLQVERRARENAEKRVSIERRAKERMETREQAERQAREAAEARELAERQAREAAEARAHSEREARIAAEAELAKLRAMLQDRDK